MNIKYFVIAQFPQTADGKYPMEQIAAANKRVALSIAKQTKRKGASIVRVHEATASASVGKLVTTI